jgi:phosphoglycerol transferase MdoB-like AlkP superfamily enzyme
VSITGDHSYWVAKGVGSDEEFKRYAVPFYVYAPEALKPKSYDKNNFGSHEDIFPSLYHLTLSEQKYVKLGENLFAEEGFAMNSSGIVANKKGAFHHGKFWKWKSRKKQILEESAEEIPGIVPHREGLISITDLYLKSEKNGKPLDEVADRQE